MAGVMLLLGVGFAGLMLLVVFTPYEPILVDYSRGDQPYVERPDLYCAEHLNAMRQILSRYGKTHFTIGGQLFISRALALNKEILANYCAKAEGLRESPGP